MPKVNIYLPDDLAAAVKDTGVPLSAVCQRALEQAIRRVTQIREIFAAEPHAIGVTDPPAVNFTARAMRMLQTARATAQAGGLAAAGTAHLLSAIADDGDSLAVRVLSALEVTPKQIRSELDRREHADEETRRSTPGRAAPRPADGEAAATADGETAATADGEAAAATSPGLDAQVATVLELAAIESSSLGNSYLGTEHLLLGLIGEPDGVAGSVLRSLGADLRVTRRMVAAALAGWAARSEWQRHRPADVGSGAPASQDAPAGELAAAIRTELMPVVARIERLEARLA
jgi:ATP-dependent Clp protease ATP-binding subunit ClpA